MTHQSLHMAAKNSSPGWRNESTWPQHSVGRVSPVSLIAMPRTNDGEMNDGRPSSLNLNLGWFGYCAIDNEVKVGDSPKESWLVKVKSGNRKVKVEVGSGLNHGRPRFSVRPKFMGRCIAQYERSHESPPALPRCCCCCCCCCCCSTALHVSSSTRSTCVVFYPLCMCRPLPASHVAPKSCRYRYHSSGQPFSLAHCITAR